MNELLKDLHNDLGEINAPKKAHIAIDQIMKHYYQRAENESKKPEKSEKKD